MAQAVGIDLGTTNSVVAVMEGGSTTVIINSEGNRLTPSVVGCTKTGECLVGQLARRQAVLNPENTIYSAKRFIGRRYNEGQDEIKNAPFKVVSGPNNAVRFEIQGNPYAPEEIAAMVLRKLVADAAKYLGEKITEVVITVPAGAIPKDGPSAGITLATALASVYTGLPVHSDTAMTGEMTLTGLVLPIGGVKEKVLAARRADLHRVILPIGNAKDLRELPENVRAEMEFLFAACIEDVCAATIPELAERLAITVAA